MRTAVSFVEIPVADMDRAVAFYEKVLGLALERRELGDLRMALLPGGEDGPPAALALHPRFYRPSADGALVYLSSPSGDLARELDRVEAAGGAILVPKRRISEEFGYMGVFTDSEGNRIALHSAR